MRISVAAFIPERAVLQGFAWQCIASSRVQTSVSPSVTSAALRSQPKPQEDNHRPGGKLKSPPSQFIMPVQVWEEGSGGRENHCYSRLTRKQSTEGKFLVFISLGESSFI